MFLCIRNILSLLQPEDAVAQFIVQCPLLARTVSTDLVIEGEDKNGEGRAADYPAESLRYQCPYPSDMGSCGSGNIERHVHQ